MKVIIAEKPDQATKLATPFSHQKKQGFYEIKPNEIFPNGAYLTWAVGHICELLSPEEYDEQWKKWRVESLPMIPSRFQYKVMKSKYKQFNIIQALLHKHEVNEVIHAGDAGREGELIIRSILSTAKCQKPMKRLWLSSLTKKAVIEGFNKLKEETETRNLYYEAYSRACADWVVGMNASRIYTLLLNDKGISDVFSAGRVQTPTLAMIVKRENEIKAFKSEPFWEVLADFTVDGKVYSGKWEKDGESRLKEKEKAEAIARFCKGKEIEIKEVKKESKDYLPPFLFNLSSLQTSANKAFKFSPKKTLDIAQKLYVKGMISYPRSDSSFVTQEEAATFPDIFKKLSKNPSYSPYFPLPIDSVMKNKRYVNPQKVTDHYAIIPTEQVPSNQALSPEEQKIYDLIVRRLIAAHYDKAVFDYTKITTVVDKRAEFVSKGKQQIQEGWRKVIPVHDNKDDLLPIVQEGEQGDVKKCTVKEGKTQPPKRFTEGQLISLMKSAGKEIDNQELEKILRDTEGLGTEATRASIITILKQRKYIEVTKNQVYATEKGMLFIHGIGEKILTSPEMTAKWEQRLKQIGSGDASPKAFMDQTKKLVNFIVEDAKQSSEKWDFSEFDLKTLPDRKRKSAKSLGKCQLCNGNVIDKGNFYGCNQYQKSKCTFTISKTILGKKISQTNIKKMLKEGKTDLIKGFTKNDKTFDASLCWNAKEKRIDFSFNHAELK